MKLYSPAAERNTGPLLSLLQRAFPARGLVLELAAGTGQHAVAFAAGLPGLTWLPTDRDEAALASVATRWEEAGLPNLRPPQRLDLLERPWAVEGVAAILAVNLLHISPIAVAAALFAEAGRLLPVGAPLVTYGPYRFEGEALAPSNEAFDEDLRGRDPAWGLRAVGELEAMAAAVGIGLESVEALPANNHGLVWRRHGGEG
jgi:hypothetical protein